jgi:O-antigen ligase
MTRYGRATGLFKDPNVFGRFLVAAMLYVLSRLVAGSSRRTPLLFLAPPPLALAVLLSFSRGARLCAGVGLALYVALEFFAATSNRARGKLVGLVGLAALGGGALVVVTLQVDGVGQLFEERAALTHNYDQGPEGRFGGQEKAAGLVLQHALGIGAQQFAAYFHHEEPHNTYLVLFLNAGWLGGAMFLAIVATTIWRGLKHVLRQPPWRPMFPPGLCGLCRARRRRRRDRY